MEEVNREVRQFGVAVPGGVEHLGLWVRTLHETGNWLVLTDCSNAFNTVKRKAVLGEAANCVPALTLFVTKCYGTRLADVFFRMESEDCLLYTSDAADEGLGVDLGGRRTRRSGACGSQG